MIRRLATVALPMVLLAASSVTTGTQSAHANPPVSVSASASVPQEVAPVAPKDLFKNRSASSCLNGVTRCAVVINYGGTYNLGIGVDYRYVPGTPSYDKILPTRWYSTSGLFGWQHTGGFYVGGGACLKFLDQYGNWFKTGVGPRYFTTQQAVVTYRLVGFNCSGWV